MFTISNSLKIYANFVTVVDTMRNLGRQKNVCKYLELNQENPIGALFISMLRDMKTLIGFTFSDFSV